MPWRVVIADIAGSEAPSTALSAEDHLTAANSATVSDSVSGTETRSAEIAVALRNEGVEVIYCGVGATPAQIVQTVLHEDADALGLAPARPQDDPEAVAAFLAQVHRLLVDRQLDDVAVFTELHTDAGRSQFRHQLETFGETGLSSATATADEA